MEYFQSKLHVLFTLLCVSSIGCSLGILHEKQMSETTDDRELNNDALTWTCPFQESDSNFNKSRNWDKFLNTLYCKFSEYKIQTAKRSYRVENTIGFGKQDCDIKELIDGLQRTDMHKNNISFFLNKIAKCNVTHYESIKNITVSDRQIEELNHVLNFTLRNTLHVNCKGINMYIKGNYITTGDVIDILLTKRKIMDAKCKTLLSVSKTKFVNIFALNTFFIDVNINSSIINAHKIALMSVIAPKWENIGKNKIDLNGEDAKIPEKEDELDGKPGKPGGPGGNFFGIGSEFGNGINLEISVSGGKGSDGQDGRKGDNGIDGMTPTKPSDAGCHDKLCEKENYDTIKGFLCKKISCIYDLVKVNPFVSWPMVTGCTYEMYGQKGNRGKNGGKGGKGGKGGYPGKVEVIELKHFSRINLLKNIGQDGSDGKGGAGGLGGKKGSDIIVTCDSKYHPMRSSYNWFLVSIKVSNEKAESGQNGADGGNSDGIENPKSAVIITNLDKTKIINEYKSYLRENLHIRFPNFFLTVFLNQIENEFNVKKFYNTLGFIDELNHLEQQFHTLNKDINFPPFYQSLLSRISEYSNTPNEKGDIRPYKKVLCYLYTATLGRLYNMQDNIESNLIIDIYAYLGSVQKDIFKLTDLKNAKYKEKLINKYKNEYKQEIDIKINEAKELISNEIAPELDNISREIDSQIETLVNEVIYLQEQVAKEHKELIKKQQQLQNSLGLQGLFSVFKILGGIANFLGPVGAIAGSVIETSSTIAESFISDNVDDQTKMLKLPQSISEIKSINREIKSIIDQRITCLNNSLADISLEIIKHPYILSDMSFKILSIKDRLDKLDKNKPNFKEIQALENALDETLHNKEEKSDPKNAKYLAVIKNLKRIVQLNTLLRNSYIKYRNNQAKLEALNRAIEHNQKSFKNLKLYEQKIYNSIIPMLQNIQTDLQNIMNKLGTKSKVALDVTKWHVQSTLRDMILLMHQLTRGFEVEDNLARCLEKLMEAMNALINVHEHIHDYEKDQNLANYISEISSITVSDIIIGNNPVHQNELRHAVRSLEITVRSNIVLQRYKIAMGAFKQFVFPFAHNYFKDLILPSHLIITDNSSRKTLDNLVFKAADEIEKINSKLEDYKNTVTNRDRCIGIGGFESGYVSSQPFFVWKNVQYKNMISQLLSGNVVTVKADIRNSASDKDAVKFNVIDFNFKSINETLQYEINKKLKGFQITVNHLGNSNYRYENKIYEMMTGSQEIWYYFEKKANGEPVYYSLSYKKIMHGNVTLSPYASWKIKLDNVTNAISFKDLEKYKDSVDLTLEGYGYFLNKRSKNCKDLMVDKYYKAVGAYNSLDPNIKSYVIDKLYPLQDNIFKKFHIFKGFF